MVQQPQILMPSQIMSHEFVGSFKEFKFGFIKV